MTPVLRQLHWLHVKQKIDFKLVAVMAYTSLLTVSSGGSCPTKLGVQSSQALMVILGFQSMQLNYQLAY